MTFEEMLEEIKDKIDVRKYDAPGPYIQEKWIVGGQTGGSCWDTSYHYSRETESEPEFEDLDKIFEILCPDITFLKYKNICREVIIVDEHTNGDYYGNYTDYKRKRVDLQTLYNQLKEKWLI